MIEPTPPENLDQHRPPNPPEDALRDAVDVKPQSDSTARKSQQRGDEADLLARNHPLLRTSICLACRSHRTIVSGKGSVFLLCQSDRTPDAWPKYPPQPVSRCAYFHPQEPDIEAASKR